MRKEICKIIKIVIIIICFSFNTDAQILNNYGYENWPGKNGIAKTDVIIPHQLVSKYDMSFRRGSTETYLRYKIALNENDTIKNGYLHIRIFLSTEEAQLALVENLEVITDLSKPPLLTNEDFKAGDVAFGKDKDGILWMAFTRNNVLAIVCAPIEKARNIAHEIDKTLLSSPEWKKNTSNPLFILTE